MPTPPFGVWEEDICSDSKVTGIHSILLYTGKVLLFHCRSYPFWSRIYDPSINEMSAENQVVPDWPYSTGNPIEPSAIFCSGHCALPDGKILVAGGERVRPYPDANITGQQPVRGLRYVFIFDPENDSWSIPASAGVPHAMDDGRWYPTLTVLHNGTILTMAGLSSSLNTNLTSKTNRTPARYIPGTGWSPYTGYRSPATRRYSTSISGRTCNPGRWQ